jgi:two-component system nitrogen regulation sensor histidine kinase NtrY
MGRLVREALVLQQQSRPEIAWITQLPEEKLHVACDRRLINQALTNLLNNAADAIAMRAQRDAEAGLAPERPLGHIRVGLSPAGEKLIISVEDDGIGLPEGDQRDRLTEPYVTHKTKGTGLGLAIVKKIMEDHRGSIQLSDALQGQGARAELILPALEPEAVPSGAEAGPGMEEHGHGA